MTGERKRVIQSEARSLSKISLDVKHAPNLVKRVIFVVLLSDFVCFFDDLKRRSRSRWFNHNRSTSDSPRTPHCVYVVNFRYSPFHDDEESLLLVLLILFPNQVSAFQGYTPSPVETVSVRSS
uniref:Uncharacterized protein n=1 Tax=mine drainage metagenome TaxID=410659 RepID=E6PX24_9ZZZZ